MKDEFGTERSTSDLIRACEADGHSHNLMAARGGIIRCTTWGFAGPASAGHVEAFRRFEGASDPDDMCLVAAVPRTRPDGVQCAGVLVVAFGPTASPEDQETFAALQFDPGSRTGAAHDGPIVVAYTRPDPRTSHRRTLPVR